MTPEPLRVPDYLPHVLLAVQRIRKYTEDISEEDFYSDERTQDAVIRRLSRVYRMRNKLAHGYFSIDLSVIWHTIPGA